jgi:hypothetical protein
MKHIELKTVNQGTALATGMLALPPLVLEGLEEFTGSFDCLCLHAGIAAIEATVAADGADPWFDDCCGGAVGAGAVAAFRDADWPGHWLRRSFRYRAWCVTADLVMR